MTSSLNSISNAENQVTEINCELPPDSPLISVIVPCYNHGKFLKECVESVINQTYKNWECIIVNDGSTDNTSQEAISLINHYSNCRIFFLEKPNTGVAETRNAGVEKSSGEFVLFLDADDKIHANFLTDAANILQSHPQVGFVYTDIQHFGVRNDCVSHGDFKPSQFLRSNQATVTSLFRKQIYSQIGGFKKEMEAGLEDWEFWVSAYEKGWQGYRLAKAYLYYRQHSAGSRLQNLLTSQAQQKIQFAKIIFLHHQLYEKEEIDWAKEILSQEKSLLVAEKLELDFIDNVVSKIEHYQKNNSDLNTLNELRQIRQQIAEEWLRKPSEQLATNYRGTLGKVSQLLLSSGLKIECLNDNEKSFIDEVIANLTTHFDEPVAVKYLLAAMLYRDAYQLAVPIDLSFIPEWFLSNYLKFVLQSPPFFKESGEVDTYSIALKQWINYLHDTILSNEDSVTAKQLAFYFTESANFLCLYSQKENFQETFLKVAKLIEYFLKTNGAQIDWGFPLISTRKKIKLGVLTPPLMPSLETFVSLPIYEYISREFEVILYSFAQTGDSIEKYCQSCANSFKKLPTNLTEAVNLIRNEYLDILYIAANITNVIDPINLLAAHRLARVQITNSFSGFNIGIKQIDYYISDEVKTFEMAQYNDQEKLIKVDNFSLCFSYGESAETACFKINRKNLEIPENSIVFVSTANFFSVTPEVIKTWSEILANVKNSILVILPFTQNSIKNYIKDAFLSYVKNEFNKNNIPSSHLIILDPPNPSREDIKECLKLGNIYLDSLAFLDIGFIIEALEIKLPIITKQGMYFSHSVASSLLHTLEISHLVTHSEETYIQQAINLATNPNLRQNISQEIVQKMQVKPSFLDSQSYSAKLAPVLKKTLQQYYARTLPQIFKLREINLIIFPDWNKSENILVQELFQAVRAAINHSQKDQITLLIELNNISEETAELTLSSIIIELLMNEDLDVIDGPEISFLSNLSKIQWQALLPKINGKIILENENQQSLAQIESNNILIGYTSDSLSQTTFV